MLALLSLAGAATLAAGATARKPCPAKNGIWCRHSWPHAWGYLAWWRMIPSTVVSVMGTSGRSAGGVRRGLAAKAVRSAR